MTKTICLSMIIQNNSDIIIETLNNLFKYIDFEYWTIRDMFSTDNTRELILDFFKKKNIPGELITTLWKNRVISKTAILDIAYNKSVKL